MFGIPDERKNSRVGSYDFANYQTTACEKGTGGGPQGLKYTQIYTFGVDVQMTEAWVKKKLGMMCTEGTKAGDTHASPGV